MQAAQRHAAAHRSGFRRYWRWKSRSLGGRPQIAADLRALIRRMSAENPLWAAPRIQSRARPIMLKDGTTLALFAAMTKHMAPNGRVEVSEVCL
jgi:hypothetical protein